MTDFPSSVAARKCLSGEGCSDSIYWVLRRMLLINGGLRLAGEKKRIWKKSIYGALAVEGFIYAYTATHMDQPVASLPSSNAALNGNWNEILTTYIGRSAIVGAGLWAGGDRKHLVKNALISAAMIELAVMIWAQEKQQS